MWVIKLHTVETMLWPETLVIHQSIRLKLNFTTEVGRARRKENYEEEKGPESWCLGRAMECVEISGTFQPNCKLNTDHLLETFDFCDKSI